MLASSDDEISDAHSSDFAYESDSESDTDLRGLDFSSLPVQTNTCKTFKHSNHHPINVRTINYKYPCGVCHGPCRENTQDSIQCSLCDEWVHQKCTNLTYNQFLEYCDPNNADKPYHCDWCEFGSSACPTNQTCLSASAISSLDSSDIYSLCPNSIFNDKEDIPTTEYFTTEELNIEIQKTPDNIRLIHINAVSLCKHVDDIIAMIAKLSKDPSIIFISETRVHDEKEVFQNHK